MVTWPAKALTFDIVDCTLVAADKRSGRGCKRLANMQYDTIKRPVVRHPNGTVDAAVCGCIVEEPQVVAYPQHGVLEAHIPILQYITGP